MKPFEPLGVTNTGFGMFATRIDWRCSFRSQPTAIGVLYTLCRISWNFRPDGSCWFARNRFTLYAVVVFPLFCIVHVTSVIAPLVMSGGATLGFVMSGLVMSGFVMSGLVMSGFVISGFISTMFVMSGLVM